MTEQMNVTLRSFEPKDRPFIYATWLKGQFYDITECIRPNKPQYFTAQGKRIGALLDSDKVTVRIAGDASDLLWIAGYSVSEGPDLHWVYVRADYRRRGIANLLTRDLGITHAINLTKTGSEIADKKGLIFKPNTGENNGNRSEQVREKGQESAA